MLPLKRLASSTVLAISLALPGAGVAAAAPPFREVFHDQFSFAVPNFCGDLPVRIDVDFRGSVTVGTRGANQLAYFKFEVHGSISWTNEATNKTMTSYQNYIDKDLKVIDNGDGTLTIIGMATGGDRLVGPDGKLLLRDPGQIRYELLIDHMGTPGDPFDDELIANLGIIFGSTGLNGWDGVDFCSLVHETLG